MANILPDAIELTAIQRVLVVKLRHYGDVLLASPVFNTLQRSLPQAKIDALVYAETAPLLEHHPAIRQVFTIDRHWKKQGSWRYFCQEFALWRQLRQQNYDLLIHLTEHPRGAWIRRTLQIPYAVARHSPAANWLWRTSFSHYYPTPKNRPRHTVETNLDALRRLGILPTEEDKKLTLITPDATKIHIQQLLQEKQLTPQHFLVVHPGSRWWFKTWPQEKMCALLQQLQRDGWPVVLTGAKDPREQAMIEGIQSKLTVPVINLAGQLNLLELAAVIQEARLFIGVDSLPMHLAAAQQTPVIALFGPSGEQEWGPWRVPHRIVASQHHPCRPCGLDGCGGSKISECLQDLPVTEVKAAVDALLRETAHA